MRASITYRLDGGFAGETKDAVVGARLGGLAGPQLEKAKIKMKPRTMGADRFISDLLDDERDAK